MQSRDPVDLAFSLVLEAKDYERINSIPLDELSLSDLSSFDLTRRGMLMDLAGLTLAVGKAHGMEVPVPHRVEGESEDLFDLSASIAAKVTVASVGGIDPDCVLPGLSDHIAMMAYLAFSSDEFADALDELGGIGGG